MEDLAVTALRKVLGEVLDGRYGELEGTLAEAMIGAAQDVRFYADAGRLELVFVREA